MSVRLNLLPDLRQAKLREQGRKRLAITVAIITSTVCVAIVLVMAIYSGAQKVIISNYSKNINDKQTALSNMSGLLDALTAEAHASSLPGLYDSRVYFSHFFKAYAEVTPAKLSISGVSVDSSNVLKVNGVADTYATVAKLVRAMSADNVTLGTGATASNQPYFTAVSIDSVSKDDTGVTFAISATVGSGATRNGNK